MAYVIAEPCIGTKDHACVDACPVDCIHPAKERDYHGGPETRGTKNFDEVPQLYIDPVECIDCGACVQVCPVTAIFPLDDLPESAIRWLRLLPGSKRCKNKDTETLKYSTSQRIARLVVLGIYAF